MQVATFEQGLKNTLEKLTFSEKTLAQGLLYSVQHDSKTLRASVPEERARFSFLWANGINDRRGFAPQHCC